MLYYWHSLLCFNLRYKQETYDSCFTVPKFSIVIHLNLLYFDSAINSHPMYSPRAIWISFKHIEFMGNVTLRSKINEKNDIICLEIDYVVTFSTIIGIIITINSKEISIQLVWNTWGVLSPNNFVLCILAPTYPGNINSLLKRDKMPSISLC